MVGQNISRSKIYSAKSIPPTIFRQRNSYLQAPHDESLDISLSDFYLSIAAAGISYARGVELRAPANYIDEDHIMQRG